VIDEAYQKAFHLHIHLIVQITRAFLSGKFHIRAQIEVEAKGNMKIVDCFGFFVQKTLIVNDI